jgi:hypothetical protein
METTRRRLVEGIGRVAPGTPKLDGGKFRHE